MIPKISLPLLDDLEDTLYTYLNEKIPHIPSDAKETIVKYLPYAAIIFIVAQISAILAFFHVSTLFDGLGYLYSSKEGVIGIVGIILLIVAIALEGIALPLLFRRVRYGWRLLLYSVIIAQVNEVINLNIINILIIGLVTLYILFQVREYYK